MKTMKTTLAMALGLAALTGLAGCPEADGGEGEGETAEGEGEAGEGEGEGEEGEGEGEGEGEAEGEGPAVTVVEVTIDGTVTTLNDVEVRRGLLFTPPLPTVSSSGGYGAPITAACNVTGDVAQGGQTLIVRSVGLSGNIVGNCAENLAQVDGAEDNMQLQAGGQCNGSNSCVYDPTAAMDAYLFECEPQNLVVTLEYECVSLAPAPAFTVPTPRLTVAATDGIGENVNCGERGAQFVLDGAPIPFDAERCTITITHRGERSITGFLNARLLGQDAPHDVTMTFEHNRNRIRPAAGLHLGNDVCLSNTITHTVRNEGGETFDDFVTGPLTCQRGEPLEAMTIVRRRADAASTLVQDAGCGLGRFNVSHEGRSTVDGVCAAVHLPAESEQTLRFVASRLRLCDGADCIDRPIAFLSIGFGDAAAAIP